MSSASSSIARFALLACLAACGTEEPSGHKAAPVDLLPAEPEPEAEPDTTPPQTTLTDTPPVLTNQSAAAFTFAGTDNQRVAQFACRLDDSAWSECRSPVQLGGLVEGSHTFAVRAIDAAGNADPTPATFAWRIDLTPPDTLIADSPAASTSATSAIITFGGTDAVGPVAFECNLDGLGWSACVSPLEYAGLATGVRTVSVRAKDAAGNLDTSPAAATWTVIPPFTTLTPACFTGGETPQLDLAGPDFNWTWNDPHVLKVGAEYWMYASATDTFQFPVRLYRLTSTDGTHWARNPTEPVLADAAAGAWDAGGLETPAVVFFQGQYHLFYTAYPYLFGDPLHSAFDYRVGHAVSSDGVTFTRAATVPVFAPSGTTDTDPGNDWYAFITGEPGPVVHNGELYVYFTTVGADAELGTSLEVLGVVRSADGMTWSAPELALKPDQTIYPRNQDWVGYSTPNAIVINGGVHLFFDVAHQPTGGDWLQLRLHHAYSPDGLTGWVHDPAPIRSAGEFGWAVDEIRSPHALLEGTELRLYFAGHELNGVGPEHFAVGMMRCDLAAP